MNKKQASMFYPYFDSEEKSTVDKMVGFLNEAIYRHEAVLTDFLDPRQRTILKTVAGKDASVEEFGGYAGAEKKRVCIAADSSNIEPTDFGVTACIIAYPSKFARLTHSSILGSLANSGVEVSAFGDIITDGKGQWQFFAKSELVSFFQQEITRIGRTRVHVNPVAQKDVLKPEDDSSNIVIVAASLRLDAILAKAGRLSRQKCKDAITNNAVKLNWHIVRDSNIIVKEKDVLSLRYFGRCQITNIETTRKNKFKVVLRLWQTKKNGQSG